MSKTKSQIVAEFAARNNIPLIDVPVSKGVAFGDFAGYPMEGIPSASAATTKAIHDLVSDRHAIFVPNYRIGK